MFNVMNLNPFQTLGWLFSCSWEVKTPISITFVSHQVQGTVRSETVVFCMDLGRRAHHNAQQTESFCPSSASLSTLQTWCFLILFIVITGKSADFWNRKAILHTSSSHCLTAFFFFFHTKPFFCDCTWCYFLLMNGPSKKPFSSELNLLI